MSEHLSEDSNEENSWVLDSLVGFLKGPVWNLTIQSFIEHKSVVFESEDESEVLAQEYRLLYDQYKNLVDRLLSGHMSDLGISAQQFDEACNRADGLLAAKVRQVLFEQIWAANDYNIFVRFMTQRNIELQLQALEVLAQRFGLVYESFLPLGANKEDYLNDEEFVINEAIKRSLEEGDSEKQSNNGNETSFQSIGVLAERKRLEAERQREQNLLTQAIQSVIIDDKQPELSSQSVKQLPKLKEESIEYKELIKSNVKHKERESESKSRTTDGNTIEEKRKLLESEAKGLSAEEIRERSEYLRNQRDKLLELKKQERDKQLIRIEAEEVLAKRPKSARAMRSVVDNIDEDSDGQNLAFRRSLAARLKSEVIEQQKH